MKFTIADDELPIPLRLILSSPIEVGQTIHIIGTAAKGAKRFYIDFYKGNFSNTDIPLHLSIRWNEGLFSNKIVYNTQKNGNWGKQELRIKHPFKREEEFDLRIRFLTANIQIFGNRKLLGTFKAVDSISNANSLTIAGDLDEIHYVHYTGAIYAIPYVSMISLSIHDRIDISGVPKGNRINFGLYDVNRDCIFLISIRFNEKAVVRNTEKNHQWGMEEREGRLPIRAKELFDLSISCEPWSYQIYFNGKHFAAYSHKTNVTNVISYKIDGDVELHTITHFKSSSS